ncbi:Os04g0309250 [Oryza sativa Japonica Group]|uniref:Os04g0309250 protein n=1 Tax=Oryza sativa subsp. japonica TaxID=39947 RepID=A0A0P0W8H3_ORYSJ|nr:Os04g0309250 [Oryza sativa Japonica Group]
MWAAADLDSIAASLDNGVLTVRFWKLAPDADALLHGAACALWPRAPPTPSLTPPPVALAPKIVTPVPAPKAAATPTLTPVAATTTPNAAVSPSPGCPAPTCRPHLPPSPQPRRPDWVGGRWRWGGCGRGR